MFLHVFPCSVSVAAVLVHCSGSNRPRIVSLKIRLHCGHYELCAHVKMPLYIHPYHCNIVCNTLGQ